jgi:hypothetical protein
MKVRRYIDPNSSNIRSFWPHTNVLPCPHPYPVYYPARSIHNLPITTNRNMLPKSAREHKLVSLVITYILKTMLCLFANLVAAMYQFPFHFHSCCELRTFKFILLSLTLRNLESSARGFLVFSRILHSFLFLSPFSRSCGRSVMRQIIPIVSRFRQVRLHKIVIPALPKS